MSASCATYRRHQCQRRRQLRHRHQCRRLLQREHRPRWASSRVRTSAASPRMSSHRTITIRAPIRARVHSSSDSGLSSAMCAATQFRTAHNAQDPSGNPLTGFATIDGGFATTPVFQARQTNVDGRLEYQILKPHFDIAGSYIDLWNNYGYPRLTGGGFGLDKLPDFQSDLGWYGSIMYYPAVKGTYVVPAGPNAGMSFVAAIPALQVRHRPGLRSVARVRHRRLQRRSLHCKIRCSNKPDA